MALIPALWGPGLAVRNTRYAYTFTIPWSVCREGITEPVSNTSSITVSNIQITTGHIPNTYIIASMVGSTITQRKYFRRKRSHGPSHAITLQATDWEDVPSSHRRCQLLLHPSCSSKSGQVNSQGQSREYIWNCTRKPSRRYFARVQDNKC